MKDFKFVLVFFLIWRIILFIPLIFSQNIQYRANSDFTNVLNFVSSDSFIKSYLVYPWANFDGVHYLSIAGNGYTTDGRFFPSFPILINFLSGLLGDKIAYSEVQFLSGLILANLFFFLALIFFYKLVKKEYSEKAAKIATVSMALFPTSFFFGSIYSESLFLMLVLVVFYFIEKGNWFFAGLAGMLLTSTRLVGISIFPAILYELLKMRKNMYKFFSILLVPFGLIGFSLYSYFKWGDFLNFLYAHGAQGNSRSLDTIVFPFQTIFRYLKIFFYLPATQLEWWIAMLEISVFVFVICMLVVAWKKKIKTSYLIYSLVAFLIPVLSGTFSGLPRYTIVLFPIFITIGLIENKIFKLIYFIISPVLLFILLMFFSRGYYIS